MASQVKSIEHLRELVSNDVHDYFIRLRGGIRSSKFITDSEAGDGELIVMNLSDGSESRLSDTNAAMEFMRNGFQMEVDLTELEKAERVAEEDMEGEGIVVLSEEGE